MNKKAPGRRGRPRDPKRIDKVLQAAADLFLTHGFERAGMDAIAQASGVSKVTIYRYFPTKEALFEAVVAQRTDQVFDALSTGPLDPADPKAALTVIGSRFLALKRSEPVLGTFRAMYAEAGRQADACRAFYRQGPEKLVRQVAEYLQAAQAAGSLVVADPARAADQFLSLFLGADHIKAMLGLGVPGAAHDRRLVEDNVRLFLAACRAKVMPDD
ncbi:TetR/AcrR family transcriptional regulator [Acidihalobacter prosperus]|uniref:HTH tetR-type domain-containing protein n=1 Tax=Acidihalobacter prosperus TaxID=160660 RepID=A0A1A6C4H4_9GAMM|nr:TetR/AcrR family transcriptional regulator [Acidihalobacter prosperus]OBS09454.1 hypothetical protein Thpro_021782 [Acidihalobacter prosperus]